MKGLPLLNLVALLLLAVFIWTRDMTWMAAAGDTLPVLAAFPLFFWLTLPWQWKESSAPLRLKSIVMGIVLCLAGIVVDSTLLLTVGCILFFDIFQTTYLQNFSRRYFLLLLFGFPWVAQDFPALGWFFRHSGAGAVEMLFQVLGYTVTREGTLLSIGGMPLSVDPACAGLNVLQAMLVAGSLVICLMVPSGWRFGVAVGALLPLAWLANTMRIFMLGLVGSTWGADFAMGWFHKWGGWAVLCVMYILCQALFYALSAPEKKTA